MPLLRIQRSIFLEIGMLFIFALIVVTATLFAAQSLQTLDRLQGLEARYVWSLLPSLLPVAISYGMPYAFLLAVALTYGRMAAERELVILRIAGIHPRVVVAPVLALGAVLSLLAFVGYGWVLPGAARAVREQERNLPDIFFASLSGSEEGLFVGQMRFSYRSYSPAAVPGGSGDFHDFELDMLDPDHNLLRKCVGDEARLSRRGNDLVLESDLMWLLQEDREGGSGEAAFAPRFVSIGSVEDLGVTWPLASLLGNDQFERKAKDVDWPELSYMVARGDLPKVPLLRSLIEMHARLAGSLAPLVFGLVAAAVGLQISPRNRRLTGFLLAFLPIILIHLPLAIAGKSLAEGGRVAPWVGMWLANAVLLAAGAVLLRRAYVR